jgi:predicted membrane channel-forming protein YqfA (hemolysin III family)
MNLDSWLAVLVICISAAFAISGKYQKSKFIHYAFKPLTMIMIISLAW